MSPHKNILILAGIILALVSIGAASADEADIDITTIKYTNDFENGEAVNIVPSGKNESTEYSFRIFDDDDDFPDDWEESSFDDSDWDLGSAPFGNKANDGVEPGTIWQSEHTDGSDGDNDYIIIRKNFTIEDTSAVLGGKIKSAYTNYYAVYLNGQQIQNCLSYSGGCYEGEAEYWNKDISININFFTEGNNTLVLVGRDSLWGGGDNTTWLDCELDLKVQSWKENPIVLGDDLVLGIDFFNNEESNVTNLNVTLEIEGTEFSNQTIEIENNKTFEWRVEWTPDRLGEFNVTAKVLNESLTRFIHIGYYAYNFSVDDDYNVGNTSELLTYNITISNEGDVNDNYTFQLFGAFNEWDVEFVPNVINLAPGETGTVKLEIIPDNGTYSGIYELTLTARSQYHGEIENMIVQSGRDNETEWKWVNSTGGRLYEESNTTWTEIDFVPNSNWTLSPAPFGDDDLSGIDYNTEWAGNNYAYFRHVFYIDDLSNYENDTLSLNMAANNYGTYYLNGEEIFNDLGWGSGHYAEYWNEEIKFNSSLLKVGKNVLASVVRETGNTQWFDEELVSVTPKSSAWGFQPDYLSLKLEVLPVYAFELVAPIEEKAISEEEACCEQDWTYKFEIWLYNRGNIEDSYEINVTLNDTVNFAIVDYDSLIHAEFDEEVTINLIIALNPSVTEFSVGELNISVTSMNSTEEMSLWTMVKARMYIIQDTLPPGTYAESDPLINNSSFEIRWFIEDWYKNDEVMGNDTKYFIIEYKDDNGTNGETWGEWNVWQNFSSEQSSAIFTDGLDGYRYRFRSVGGDNEGLVENKEDKYDTQTIVDLSAPYANIELRVTGNVTNLDYIEFEWTANHPNITGYEVQYRLNNQNWTTIEESTLARWAGFNIPIDGEYDFRVITSDEAGNKGISEISRKILVDTIAPNTNIQEIQKLTDAEEIEINIDTLEDTVNLTLYYSVVRENQEVTPIAWDKYGEYVASDLPISVSLNNQFHYYFKIVAYDLAGNHLINESYQDIIVDRDAPQKIRNLEIKDTKEGENGTTDIVVSFMSSQSQDLSGYRIYRSIDENETGTVIGTKEAGELYLSYRDSRVDMGYKYYYSVVAVDRMNFESEPETLFIVLEAEEPATVIEEDSESSNNPLFIGMGVIGVIALGGAGFYFLSNKAGNEIITGIGEASPSNFTEMDGEFLCGACGSMFEMTDDKTCPSCGTVDE
jgi:hypothetical protein